MKCLCILFLICNLLSQNSEAQKVVILNKEETFLSGNSILVYEDPAGKLTIDDIIRMNNKFIPYKKDVLLFTETTYTFWVRFELRNDYGKNFYLVVENPFINQLDLYALDSNKAELLSETGNLFPFDHRPILKNNFIFPVNIPPGRNKIFYVRYNSTWRLELPLFIKTSKKIIENEAFKDMWYGFFYGVIAVSLIYVFFMYLMIKDQSYIYFLLFILSISFVRSLNHGLSFQFLFPNHPHWNNYLIYFFLSLFAIFLLRFTQTFLKTKIQSPFFNMMGNGIIVSMVLIYVLSFLDQEIWFYSINISFIVLAIYILIVGLKLYIQRYTPARFYLVSAMVYTFTILTYIIRNFGFLSYSFVLYNVSDILFAATIICFSLAVGDRYNEIEKEKNDTQYRLNKELELKIAERTRASLEEKRLSENLGQSLSLLSATLEATADGILVVDLEGKIIGFNRQFAELWMIPDHLLQEKDDKKALDYVMNQLINPEIFLSKVNELHSKPEVESFDVIEFKDGKIVERYSKPQMLGKVIIGRVWSFRDVTIRRHAEDKVKQLNIDLKNKIQDLVEAQAELQKTNLELRQTNTDLDNFIYAASHNVKGPASSLEGLINLLDLGIYSPNELPQVISMMKSLMVKFNQTIIDLTELSKVQNIIEMKDISFISIEKLTNEVKEELKESIDSTNAIIHIDFNEVDSLLFSKLNFKRIIFNLLSNALKFRSPNRVPEISIKSYHKDGHIVISIKDNGLGIASYNKEKVFQMFKRAHEHIEGRGIGLYVVKRIVENAGGRIELESTEGTGSVFRVFFKRDFNISV
jgi:signal transduction histidine kinase